MTGPLRWLWAGALATVLAAPACAATFNVSPVRINLSAAKRTEVLSVTNDGDSPTVIQCQAMAWSQQGGRDVYAATEGLIATPPIFTVAPGKTQIVRVGLRQAPQGLQEAAYRVYLQEIPGPPEPGFRGLRIALRIGVPVFVAAAQPVGPVMQWKAQLKAGGGVSIGLHNAGGAHVQIFDFSVSRAGTSKPLARERVSTYVLAGQSAHWSLEMPREAWHSGEMLHLKAYTDAGDIDKDLVLEGP